MFSLVASGGGLNVVMFSRYLEEFPPLSPDTSVSLWDLSGLTIHLVEHMLSIVSSLLRNVVM